MHSFCRFNRGDWNSCYWSSCFRSLGVLLLLASSAAAPGAAGNNSNLQFSMLIRFISPGRWWCPQIWPQKVCWKFMQPLHMCSPLEKGVHEIQIQNKEYRMWKPEFWIQRTNRRQCARKHATFAFCLTLESGASCFHYANLSWPSHSLTSLSIIM